MVSSITPAETFAELHEQLGFVPLSRIRLHPPPGTATVEDVARLCDREPKRLCELVDGVLVEKDYGHPESRLALRLSHLLACYLDEHDIGFNRSRWPLSDSSGSSAFPRHHLHHLHHLRRPAA